MPIADCRLPIFQIADCGLWIWIADCGLWIVDLDSDGAVLRLFDYCAGHPVVRDVVRDGRITQIPMQHAKRRILLEWLVQDFEPGTRYSEKMVNLVLGKRHADTAALRRGLVDEELMDRDHGEYWRIGGPVDTEP